MDNYQWATLLRATSAHRAFHWAYGGEVTARKIADFLILNPQCPRSLTSCIDGICGHLKRLEKAYGRPSRPREVAEKLAAELEALSVEDIIEEGLHEFLSRFILEAGKLSGVIFESYLSGDVR